MLTLRFIDVDQNAPPTLAPRRALQHARIAPRNEERRVGLDLNQQAESRQGADLVQETERAHVLP
jgi:hypothetical protein